MRNVMEVVDHLRKGRRVRAKNDRDGQELMWSARSHMLLEKITEDEFHRICGALVEQFPELQETYNQFTKKEEPKK